MSIVVGVVYYVHSGRDGLIQCISIGLGVVYYVHSGRGGLLYP